MSYPRVDAATCTKTAIEFLAQASEQFSSRDAYNTPENLGDALRVSVDEAVERMYELFSFFEDQNKRIDGDFDSQACSILHADLSISAETAGDTSFWRGWRFTTTEPWHQL